MPFRLLIFDLDGTLADTQEDLAAAVNATRSWAGHLPLALPEIRAAIGDGARALIQRTVPFPGPVEEPLRYFIGWYGTRCAVHTTLYPGVVEVLEATRGRVRAVLTNKPERISKRIIHKLGIAEHFVEVIGGDSLPVRKPDPAGILGLMERHGVSPGETLFIGDSQVDVATAKAAGVKVAAVLSGYSDVPGLTGADFVLTGMGGVASLLAGQGPSPQEETRNPNPPGGS